MITKYDNDIRNIAQQHNGYLRIRDVEDAGIDRAYVYTMLRHCPKEYTKVAKGIFLAADANPDWAYILQLRNKTAIISDASALSIHDLVEAPIPTRVFLSLPENYTGRHISARTELDVHMVHYDSKIHKMGVMEKATHYGNIVKVYDPERCICDLVRKREWKFNSVTDKEYINTLRKYFAWPKEKRNQQSLMKYAKVFAIEKKMFNVMILLQQD